MKLGIIVSIICAPLVGLGQGSFQNLDFESANVPDSPQTGYPNPISTTAALPGWTALLGTDSQSQVQHNTETLGTATVTLLGPTWSGIAPGIIDGKYSVFLQTGSDPNNESVTDNASIEQMGTVPLDAEWLQFKAWVEPGMGDSTFTVSFGGNVLALTALVTSQSPDGEPYTLYGADVAPYAGETGELEFTSLFNEHDPALLLDDINFSTTAVPEPSPIVLAGIAAAMFAARRRWGQKRD